jgi:hypothetical protein
MSDRFIIHGSMRYPVIVTLLCIPLSALSFYFYATKHDPELLLVGGGLLFGTCMAYLWQSQTYVRYRDEIMGYKNGFLPNRKIRTPKIAASFIDKDLTLNIYHLNQLINPEAEDVAEAFSGAPYIAIPLNSFTPQDITKLIEQPWLNLIVDAP